MLMPKRVKHRKQFRGSMRGKATRGNKISYGEYGIVAMEPVSYTHLVPQQRVCAWFILWIVKLMEKKL